MASDEEISAQDEGEFGDAQSKSWLDAQIKAGSASNDSPTATKPRSASVPFLDRIAAMPKLRDVPWRPGQELPPERSTESPRVQQRGACLVATRGHIAATACTHCSSGYGRFSSCIAMDKWFQGACATCIFTSKGNKCSLRIQSLGVRDARALRYMYSDSEPSKKRKRSSLASQIPLTVNTGSGYKSPYGPPQNPYRTPEISAATKTPVEPLDPASPDMDSILQAEIAQQEGEEEEYVRPTKKRESSLSTPNPPQNSFVSVNGSGGATRPYQSIYSAPSPALNTPVSAAQPAHPPLEGKGKRSNHQIVSARPTSATSTRGTGPPAPLIDDFPKSKQREIYGITSGIQGGIENLQKQLDLLRGALGIDYEEPRIKKEREMGVD